MLNTIISVGDSVYSRERIHGGSEEPLGGVVLEHTPSDFDEGGVLLCLDHRRLRPDLHLVQLTASEVGDMEESPTQRLRILVRRLCQEVAMDGYKPRTGSMTAREADCVRWAWDLLRAMGGPG